MNKIVIDTSNYTIDGSLKEPETKNQQLTIDTSYSSDIKLDNDCEQYQLVYEDDPILRIKTPNFEFDGSVDPIELSNRLIKTLKIHRGFGIAAPQCGLSHRVFVIGAEEEYITMFNPEILEYSQETLHLEEGCLSFPFMFLSITRPKKILIKYQDENGTEKKTALDGLSARTAQHELDHLNGITFHKKAKPLALKMANKRKENNIKKFAKELVRNNLSKKI